MRVTGNSTGPAIARLWLGMMSGVVLLACVGSGEAWAGGADLEFTRLEQRDRVSCMNRLAPRRVAPNTYVLERWSECALIPGTEVDSDGAFERAGLTAGALDETVPSSTEAEQSIERTADAAVRSGDAARWTADRRVLANSQYERSVSDLRSRFRRSSR